MMADKVVPFESRRFCRAAGSKRKLQWNGRRGEIRCGVVGRGFAERAIWKAGRPLLRCVCKSE